VLSIADLHSFYEEITETKHSENDGRKNHGQNPERGDDLCKAVAERKKMPKRFSGKTGVIFLPEYQELADKPIR